MIERTLHGRAHDQRRDDPHSARATWVEALAEVELLSDQLPVPAQQRIQLTIM